MGRQRHNTLQLVRVNKRLRASHRVQAHGLRAVSVLVPMEDVQLRADPTTDLLVVWRQIGKLSIGIEDSHGLGNVLLV